MNDVPDVYWVTRIKLVPDSLPNADGEWFKLPARVLVLSNMRFNEVVTEVERMSVYMHDHHIVQYETDIGEVKS